MPRQSLPFCGPTAHIGRRQVLAGLTAATIIWSSSSRAATEPVSIGLNPLFLDSDIELLSLLQTYLAAQLARPVQLIKRRTYQEITALLLSGQLDAAWVCDDPYVQHEDQLALLAVPLYRHEPLYQTYVIVSEGSKAQSFDDIRGTVHAFSDPDSTSGFLVTRSLLALRHTTPAQFFRTFFFTYGHRNVVRAVATGLAESGSIDGYVWDVMRERDPELINKNSCRLHIREIGVSARSLAQIGARDDGKGDFGRILGNTHPLAWPTDSFYSRAGRLHQRKP